MSSVAIDCHKYISEFVTVSGSGTEENEMESSFPEAVLCEDPEHPNACGIGAFTCHVTCHSWSPVAQWLPDLLLPMSKPEGRVASFQSGHLTAFGPMSSFCPCRRLFCQSFTWTLHSPPPRPVSLHRTNTEAAPPAGQTPRSREKRHTRQVASPPLPHPAALLRAPRLTRDIGENCEASTESSPEVQKGQSYG